MFIGCLPAQSSEEELYKYFSKFCQISHLKLKYRSNRLCAGHGSFICQELSKLDKLINHSHFYRGRSLECRPFFSGAELKRYQKRFNKRRIYVGNLPPNMTDWGLFEEFSKFGDVIRAYTANNPDKQGRKFGFIVFKEEGIIEKLLGREDLQIGGFRLEINEVIRERDTKSQFSGSKARFRKHRETGSGHKAYEEELPSRHWGREEGMSRTSQSNRGSGKKARFRRHSQPRQDHQSTHRGLNQDFPIYEDYYRDDNELKNSEFGDGHALASNPEYARQEDQFRVNPPIKSGHVSPYHYAQAQGQPNQHSSKKRYQQDLGEGWYSEKFRKRNRIRDENSYDKKGKCIDNDLSSNYSNHHLESCQYDRERSKKEEGKWIKMLPTLAEYDEDYHYGRYLPGSRFDSRQEVGYKPLDFYKNYKNNKINDKSLFRKQKPVTLHRVRDSDAAVRQRDLQRPNQDGEHQVHLNYQYGRIDREDPRAEVDYSRRQAQLLRIRNNYLDDEEERNLPHWLTGRAQSQEIISIQNPITEGLRATEGGERWQDLPSQRNSGASRRITCNDTEDPNLLCYLSDMVQRGYFPPIERKSFVADRSREAEAPFDKEILQGNIFSDFKHSMSFDSRNWVVANNHKQSNIKINQSTEFKEPPVLSYSSGSVASLE